jgi:peroxiredoxin
VESVPLLSDWNGDAARAFGVSIEIRGLADVAERTTFLIEDAARIRESWVNGRDLPDLDEVIAVASA